MKAGFKLFSLQPQKKIRPINIKINPTVLVHLHNKLNNGVELEGRDLWEYYFDINKITKSQRKTFAAFLVTNGMSASICVSRFKK